MIITMNKYKIAYMEVSDDVDYKIIKADNFWINEDGYMYFSRSNDDGIERVVFMIKDSKVIYVEEVD